MGEQNERVYNPAECVTFRRTSEAFGGLSNMAPGFRVRVNGILFLTVEALYQACRFPHLPDLQAFIISQKSPMTLKMRIKKLLDESRPDWLNVRVNIMRWCLRVKLSQNLDSFATLLLATDNRPIVEDSKKDSFWGAVKAKDGSLRGENVLGRLLMELREDFKVHGSSKFKTVQSPEMLNLLLLGRPVGNVEASVTQEVRVRNGSESYIPQKNVAFGLPKHRVDTCFSASVSELMQWIAQSGLDVEAKIEITTTGGVSDVALRNLEETFDKLGLQSRRTISMQSSFRF